MTYRPLALFPYAPFTEPLPRPGAEPESPPYGCLVINREWIPYILGALEVFRWEDAWQGTPAQVNTTLGQVQNLLWMFASTGDGCMIVTNISIDGCTMTITKSDGSTDVIDLSACSVPGPQGPPGEDGEPGADGQDGANGNTPQPLWQGTTLAWDTNLDGLPDTPYIDLQGPQGPQGLPGADGETIYKDYPAPTDPDALDPKSAGDALRCAIAEELASDLRTKWRDAYDYVDFNALLAVGSLVVGLIAILVPEPSSSVAGVVAVGSVLSLFINAVLGIEGAIERDDLDGTNRDDIRDALYCILPASGELTDAVIQAWSDEVTDLSPNGWGRPAASLIRATPGDIWRYRAYTAPLLAGDPCASINCGGTSEIIFTVGPSGTFDILQGKFVGSQNAIFSAVSGGNTEAYGRGLFVQSSVSEVTYQYNWDDTNRPGQFRRMFLMLNGSIVFDTGQLALASGGLKVVTVAIPNVQADEVRVQIRANSGSGGSTSIRNEVVVVTS